LLLAAFLLALLASPARLTAQDEDPVIQTKKLSYWIKMAKTDKDWVKRRKALDALVLAGPSRKAAVTAACTIAKTDAQKEVRVKAVRVISDLAGKLPDSTTIDDKLRPMMDCLKGIVSGASADKEGAVREAAAEALGAMGPHAFTATSALARALKDKHKGARRAAAEALNRIGEDAKAAEGAMTEVLKNAKEEEGARVAAAGFIGLLGRVVKTDGTIANRSASSLLEVLKSKPAPPARVRRAVIEQLGLLRDKAGEAAPLFAKALGDKKEDEQVRLAAVTALARIGPDGKVALKELKASLGDTNKFIRIQCAEAICRLGDDAKDAVPGLIAQLKKETVLDVQVALIKGLGELGSVAKDAKGVLADFSRSAQTALREAAEDALKKVSE
jgi:HEAT repeat protein